MSQTQSQLGLLSRGTRLMPVGTATDQSHWDCFEGDAAYAGEYSHRPIPAGIALVTFVTFPRIMSQTQSQLGLLSRGPGSCRWVQPQTNPSWDCSSESRQMPKGSKPLPQQRATTLNTQHPPLPCWPGYTGGRITSQ